MVLVLINEMQIEDANDDGMHGVINPASTPKYQFTARQ